MKKTLVLTVGVVVVSVVVAGLYFGDMITTHTTTPATVIPIPVEPVVKLLGTDDGTFCFMRDQIATETAPYSANEHIVMTRAGNTITGTKTGTQSGPGVSNGFTGTLTGTLTGDVATVIYAYTVEGSDGKEQEEYQVVKDGLLKHHYQLKEENGGLVPDKSKTERDSLVYTSEPCK